MRSLSHFYISCQSCIGRDVCKIRNFTIMLQNCASIDDAVFAYLYTWIDRYICHYHCPFAYFGMNRNGSCLMNGDLILKFIFLRNFFSIGIVSHRNDGCFIFSYLTAVLHTDTENIICSGIVIIYFLHLHAISLQNIYNYFCVSACSK